MHQDQVEAIEFQTVLLHDLENCQRDAKQDSHSLEEEKIPHNENSFQRYLVDKHLDQPWKGQQISVEADFIKVHRQLLVSSLHQLIEYFLVYKHTVEAGKVVEREINFDDLTKSPESFLLVEAEEQIASDEIHALEVAYFRVALYKGVK